MTTQEIFQNIIKQRPQARMYAQMQVQIALLSERPSTVFANVRIDVSVHFHVVAQAPFRRESTRANRAPMGLFSGVQISMCFQILRPNERFPAYSTSVFTVLCVNLHMPLQIFLIHKFLIALGAWEDVFTVFP